MIAWAFIAWGALMVYLIVRSLLEWQAWQEEKASMSAGKQEDQDIDGLWLCDDCAIASANGPAEVSDEWAGFAEFWETGRWFLVLNCYPVQEDGTIPEEPVCPAFSKVRCDGCQTTLAGQRHPAVAWRNTSGV